MKISILTVFPNLYTEFLTTSLIKRAREQSGLDFDVQAFSSFCQPKEHIDGPIAGHGAGMVIRPEVVERAINAQESLYGKAYKVFLTPQGKKFDQRMALQLAQVLQKEQHIAFFAGRYEGIDQRAHEAYADLEISIGDFVLMGGDLPVMVILEALARYIPGVVGRGESVEQDSFSGPFVDFPTYTSPRSWNDKEIPEILLGGNHAAMESWRQKYAIKKSVIDHFDWVRAHCITKEQIEQVRNVIPSHYCALMHSDVIVQQTLIGTSSVTSIDVHDIARSSRTYGIKNYFVVTPLIDQQKIVAKILQFWDEAGVAYNKNRADAVSKVELKDSLENVIAAIEAQEGLKPVIVGTSAKKVEGCIPISYDDQAIVWAQKRPILFIFGTAQGLSFELIKRCDYLLGPIEGFSDFNHLSVRSAAAIIFDRWLGKKSFTSD